jgi:hypothetical protein
MENVLFEDGARRAICTISTRSKTLYEKSRKVFAMGNSHESIYEAGLDILLANATIEQGGDQCDIVAQ